MLKNNKILNLNELKQKLFLLKKNKKKIVLCHGVFDLIHLGHIKYFYAAKKNGDYLVVSITEDKFVNKGAGRPIFNQFQRAEFLSSIEGIDAIVFSPNFSAVEVIKKIRPHYYVKGIEYRDTKKDLTKNIIKETEEVKKYKGRVIYTNEKVFSSSNLINQTDLLFNEDQKKFIKRIKYKYSFEQILQYLKELKSSKIMVIGESIIDYYINCEALGKSGKEPYLAFNEVSEQIFIGGASAIARQVNEFSNNITLLSMVGHKGDYLDFFKKNIPKNVISFFLKKRNSPTIVKKRFIDNVSGYKIFGSYSINSDNLNKSQDNVLNNFFRKKTKSHDLILVSDYGHGFITEKFAKNICSKNSFIALNAQVNAANIGFHTLKKYQKVDAMIINETELRHEMRNKSKKIIDLAKELILRQNIKNLVVTMGSSGVFLLSKKEYFYCPAFGKKIVDKVGAGDSMLSILSLCLKSKIPKDLSIFLGSLVAALSIEIIGNKQSVKFDDLLRTIQFSIK